MKITNTHRSDEFKKILGIIQSGRSRAFEAVNIALIETYWAIGEQHLGDSSTAIHNPSHRLQLADFCK